MSVVSPGLQILSVAFSEDAGKLFAAGIDNNILVSNFREHTHPQIMPVVIVVVIRGDVI